MESKELIDRLQRIRDTFHKSFEELREGRPHSALSLDLEATRLANRTILDLEIVEKTLKKKKS
jgi:hypothetical protein